MEHKLCSGFDIQNSFLSTVVLTNEVSDVTGPAPIAIKKYLRSVVLMLSYFSCTAADFEIQYFFNKVTVGVLINTVLIFYD